MLLSEFRTKHPAHLFSGALEKRRRTRSCACLSFRRLTRPPRASALRQRRRAISLPLLSVCVHAARRRTGWTAAKGLLDTKAGRALLTRRERSGQAPGCPHEQREEATQNKNKTKTKRVVGWRCDAPRHSSNHASPLAGASPPALLLKWRSSARCSRLQMLKKHNRRVSCHAPVVHEDEQCDPRSLACLCVSYMKGPNGVATSSRAWLAAGQQTTGTVRFLSGV